MQPARTRDTRCTSSREAVTVRARLVKLARTSYHARLSSNSQEEKKFLREIFVSPSTNHLKYISRVVSSRKEHLSRALIKPLIQLENIWLKGPQTTKIISKKLDVRNTFFVFSQKFIWWVLLKTQRQQNWSGYCYSLFHKMLFITVLNKITDQGVISRTDHASR